MVFNLMCCKEKKQHIFQTVKSNCGIIDMDEDKVG